jgi:type VI secretion system protein ImpC
MAHQGSAFLKERFHITYRPAYAAAEEEVELPLRLLVIGDFSGAADETRLEDRPTFSIDRDNFNDVLKAVQLRLQFSVADRLRGEDDAMLQLDLAVEQMKDFKPDSLVRQVPEMAELLDTRRALVTVRGHVSAKLALAKALTEIVQNMGSGPVAMDAQTLQSAVDKALEAADYGPEDEARAEFAKGVEAFLSALAARESRPQRVNKTLFEELISACDALLSAQLDEILHHEHFQRMESAWSALKFLVDRTDFRNNITIDLLQCSKDELRRDFDNNSDMSHEGLYRQVYRSGLFRKVYADVYDTFDGQPYAAVIGNYEFSHSREDLELLEKVATVAELAHAPFLSAAHPSMFGMESFTGLAGNFDIHELLSSPPYTKWQSFRGSMTARWACLTLPRFMLRLPYGDMTQPIKAFHYEESAAGRHENYLWGNTAFALASRITESFAKYRHGMNIRGPQMGGAVQDLPLHIYEESGNFVTKSPVEIILRERREYELSKEGFVPLAASKASDNAAFFSVNSTQKPDPFDDGKTSDQAELDFRFGLQLPYILLISRFAHYLKVIHRESKGMFYELAQVERMLGEWLRAYVSEMEDPQPSIVAHRPLRAASLSLREPSVDDGFTIFELKIKPHLRFEGTPVTLSLPGILDFIREREEKAPSTPTAPKRSLYRKVLAWLGRASG